MGHRAVLCATVVVVAGSLICLVLIAGIVTRPAQAYRGSAVSVEVAATVGPQATPTKGQPAQQGKSVQNEQVPSWLALSLLLIGCAVLLAFFGFVLWIGGLVPWHRQSQPVGWLYKVLLALLLALAAIVALAPQVFAVFTPPIWVRLVLFVLAGVLVLEAEVVKLRSTQLEKERSRARLVEQRVTIPVKHGQLPQVRDVRLDQLRVHAARVEVPYIERDQQGKLEEAVGVGQAVLVLGHSMSGKTRLAAEVVNRKFPDALLLTAESGNALQELFDGGLDPAGVVVWLDDLERFLGAEGLTVGLLNRLTAGGAIVVATIRVKQRETYRPLDELRPPEWEVLQRFSEISLQRSLTGPELSRVRATVKDPGVLDAVDHYGLAEYLGAGPEALDKFEKGEIANPVGHALVRAVLDWRRVGLIRPVSQRVLARTLPTYLADRPDVPRTKQAIDEGLAWATAKINETVALLFRRIFTISNETVFEVFDYLIDQLPRTSAQVPDLVWVLASEQAESVDLILVGQAAYRADKLSTAVTVFRRAADEGDSEVAPLGAFNLGVVLEKQGDLEGAKAAFQQAIDSGHAERALQAVINLGVVLEKQGDLEGAKAAYQQAIDSGHAEQPPKATYGLGLLLSEQGEVEEAKAVYQEAIDSGDAVVAPMAAFNLGHLLHKEGDLAGAKAIYQWVVDSGWGDWVPRARFCLGLLLHEEGDLAGAKAAYQQAIDSGDAVAAPMAVTYLERLLKGTPPPAAS